ncbi:putative protein phosphatase 2c 25 [Quercus suber]|uniref:protein-serine/threonine phosphatase n=1 Tax=Quercus suber TaxID=58331 RepID=A0AAW0JT22_QUESU
MSVAILNSPIFSPRISSNLCKSSASISNSPRVLHGLPPTPSRPSSSSSSPLPPSPSTPSTVRFNKLNKQISTIEEVSRSLNGTVLKRKRPARIDIPVMSLSFGVDTPKAVERVVDVVEVEGDGYALYCKRGRRGPMEDRYSAVVDVHGDSTQAFFGVFDGHGGAKAAEFAANHLDRHIMDQSRKRCADEIVEAVRDGYLTTDAEFLKEGVEGGTCCVTALIQEGNLVVSNAGSLAVSRGIGDRHLKQWIIAEPETKVLKIEHDCEFVILASDGLWDKVNNQEAADMVRPLCTGIEKPKPFFACKKLVDLAVTRGSTDDISVMIVQLGNFLS